MGERKSLQCGLDALGGSNGEKRLCHAGAEPGYHGPRTGELAILVNQHIFVLIERDKSCTCNLVIVL